MASAEEFGPYVVHEQIGLGGMATVHRAETQGIAGFSKQVALKRMLPNVAADANLVKSFIREARLASHLRHENVAQTYDLGKVGDVYFIAMELVPGRNLRVILKHCAAVAGHMPLPIAMNIVNQICDALDYAHNLCDESGTPLGIIHRDVSPANIIVSESGIVKLIDFGIAKASGAGMSTMSGTIKGKFGYMAPEYLMGYIDARADLFALGVIAHELLSNKPLFQGRDDMDTLTRVREMPIEPPSKFNRAVPLEIDAIIMTALERDPDRRWQRATALRSALTIETKRLGLIAHNHEVTAWIDGAFRKTRDDSAPEIAISSSTMPMPKGSVPDDLGLVSDSMATILRPTSDEPFPTPQADWKPSSDAPTRAPQPQRPSSPHTLQRRTPAPMPMPSAESHPFDVPTLLARPSAQQAQADPVDWPAGNNEATKLMRPSTALLAEASPPSDQNQPRAASAPRTEGPSQPPRSMPPVAVSGARTSPLARPIQPLASVSSRPLQHSAADSAAATFDHVRAASVGAEPDVTNILADLESRSSVSAPEPIASIARTRVESKSRRSTGNFLLAVLVLIAAGGAAAVVYFALPYLT